MEHTVVCQDIAERPRVMLVRGEHGRVVLVNPPGAGAYLNDEQAGDLMAAIQHARRDAATQA